MNYKIIACDLDGTLLDEAGNISRENWQAIARLREMGVEFVPASGRAFRELPEALRDSDLIRYYITSDGTTVYDKLTDTTHELAMPRALGHQVLDKVYRYPVCMMLHADINSYVEKKTHDPDFYAEYHMNDYWIRFTMGMEVPVEGLREMAYRLDSIQSVVPFFRNREDLLECKACFEADPRLIVAQSDPYNLEVFSAHAGKGNALYLLADLLGVSREQTIAAGDSTNDYTMVRAAGLGLAMENAVEELKQVADRVVCHHREPVVKYILEHFI